MAVNIGNDLIICRVLHLQTPGMSGFFFFLPTSELLQLKMALSAVKSVSRYNASGGRGAGANHLPRVPTQVSQGLL